MATVLKWLALFKQEPTKDTPYRDVVIELVTGLQVRVSGGITWGRGNRQDFKIVPAQNIDEAKELYTKFLQELQAEGWTNWT